MELGEVAAVLAEQPGVTEAVVVARHDVTPGEKVLVAYVVGTPSDPRAALASRLPRHMIPAAFVVLPELPLTRAGKVDRAALPAPARGGSTMDDGSIEARLAALWADTLAVEHVGRHDDFFDIGGNSLLAADVLERVRRELSVEVPAARLFFENPTVAGLAEAIHEEGSRTCD
ncbi:phosphopantetheine-binding protein [Actinophytocola sp.]|uniref:phosphopantetheine-binding protein n=1 Tax=Actinophytocola sp. TaxID=1872138 RepID=UPI002D54653F|nr:phosphopantetheine-binding protein [Actinophytocola sp.]HYQ62919.1 phosphopantetheine-binding protein [Actinophytocola sp.]